MKVGVLTLAGSRYGLRVLNALHRLDRPAAIVVVLDDGFARRWRLLLRVARRVGWSDALLYAAERQRRELGERRAGRWRDGPLLTDYRVLADEVLAARGPGDPQIAAGLDGAAVDLLLLAQSGIVPASVLAVPRLGALNAHPGWLPEYRGIDCPLWAVHRMDYARVGCTLHLVDEGVDTGAITLRRPYRWTGDETVANLEARLYEDCVDLLVAGVQAAGAGALKASPQAKGPYFHKLPRRLLPGVEANLKGFLASRHPSRPGSGR